jgi:hypothetical protein
MSRLQILIQAPGDAQLNKLGATERRELTPRPRQLAGSCKVRALVVKMNTSLRVAMMCRCYVKPWCATPGEAEQNSRDATHHVSSCVNGRFPPVARLTRAVGASLTLAQQAPAEGPPLGLSGKFIRFRSPRECRRYERRPA